MRSRNVAQGFSPARYVAQGFSPAREQRGFTLVQLALALTGLLFLSLVVPAWVAVRVNQARVARAQRDLEVIAEGIRRFEADNGFLPAWTHASGGGPGPASDRVDLLVGPGALPRAASEAEAGWLGGRAASLDSQLVENVPGYRPFDAAHGRGWRGPYLPAPVSTDPWGNRYLVSLGLPSDPEPSASAGRPEPCVLSAGPNGIIETPYPPAPGDVQPGGDDLLVAVSLLDSSARRGENHAAGGQVGGSFALSWLLPCKSRARSVSSRRGEWAPLTFTVLIEDMQARSPRKAEEP